jgi:hypothetical protein
MPTHKHIQIDRIPNFFFSQVKIKENNILRNFKVGIFVIFYDENVKYV